MSRTWEDGHQPSFYAPALIDWGNIVFGLSVCLQVCLSAKTFTLAIFWLVTVRAFIFHMSISCDKTFLLVTCSRSSARSRSVFKINFIEKTMMSLRGWSSAFFLCPLIDWSEDIVFGLSICLQVCLFVCKNFDIGHIFWLVRVRAFIIHMSLSCDKNFLLVTSSRSSALSKSVFKVNFIKKTMMSRTWEDSNQPSFYAPASIDQRI